MLATLLDRAGITGWTLELNSVGCPADRHDSMKRCARRCCQLSIRCAAIVSGER